ncbi:hypothetical protein MPLSOD_260032 [Mesorhizobium sp. SOD10]|nr:hypothetical protein MPLSOD_260032 [Mesorhizobium sp. SOD10]
MQRAYVGTPPLLAQILRLVRRRARLARGHAVPRRQTFSVLRTALSRPTSRFLCGYWEVNKLPDLIWET